MWKKAGKKNTWLRWASVCVTLMAVVATPFLFMSGCSGNPTEPAGSSFWNESFDPATLPSTDAQGPSLASGSMSVYSGSGIVSAVDGGVVDLSLPGSVHQFSVEPGSIPSDTLIDAGVYVFERETATIILFGFGPDGLRFSKSANLTFDIGSVSSNTSSVDLWWWNPDTGKWEYQRTVKANSDGIVSFEIDHFSMYGVE